MTVIARIGELTRPAETTGTEAGFAHRTIGLVAGAAGWIIVMVAFGISLITASAVASGAPTDRVAALAALSFGLAIAGLGTGKTGIALVLWGIVQRIWVRVGSLKEALPDLVPAARSDRPAALGRLGTPYGLAVVSVAPPAPLLIHRMARTMWLPMLLMGAMALYAGLVLAYVGSSAQSSDPALARSLRAWTQGTQFLGEGFLLSAISFFLGTILGAIRAGGGEVQHSLGTPVKTLAMPATAKAFVALMMLGLMIEIAQFVAYAYVAALTDAKAIAAYSAFLGPFREFGLGTLLSGIVLALATIATALEFQFARVVELVRTGR